jgi:hypothetical protein
MEASELRIGNLIASSGNPSNKETWVIGKVRSISCLDAEFEQIEVETDEDFTWFFKGCYFGIPLTPELLVEIGFGKVIGYFITTKPNISLELAENNDNSTNQWYCYVRNKNGIGVKDEFCLLRKDLLHLHQLQNLYFALTGEELTINTK